MKPPALATAIRIKPTSPGTRDSPPPAWRSETKSSAPASAATINAGTAIGSARRPAPIREMTVARRRPAAPAPSGSDQRGKRGNVHGLEDWIGPDRATNRFGQRPPLDDDQ